MIPYSKFLCTRSYYRFISPKFKHLFDGEWKNLSKVEVDDSPYEAFNEFIQYFYKGHINVTVCNALDISQLARKYDVPEVNAECVTLLASSLCAANAIALYSAVIGNESCEMKRDFGQFISDNIVDVLKTDGFLSAHVDVLKAILKLGEFQCPYVEVYDACIKWAKRQCEQNQIDPADGNNIRRELAQLDDLFRFDQIHSHHLIERCHKYKGKIFSNEQLYTLFIEASDDDKESNRVENHENETNRIKAIRAASPLMNMESEPNANFLSSV